MEETSAVKPSESWGSFAAIGIQRQTVTGVAGSHPPEVGGYSLYVWPAGRLEWTTLLEQRRPQQRVCLHSHTCTRTRVHTHTPPPSYLYRLPASTSDRRSSQPRAWWRLSWDVWMLQPGTGAESTLHHGGRWLGFLGTRTPLLFWVLAFAHWSLTPAD